MENTVKSSSEIAQCEDAPQLQVSFVDSEFTIRVESYGILKLMNLINRDLKVLVTPHFRSVQN